MRRDMKWFIQTMSLNPPIITLSGYITLNRGFNVSVSIRPKAKGRPFKCVSTLGDGQGILQKLTPVLNLHKRKPVLHTEEREFKKAKKYAYLIFKRPRRAKELLSF